MIVFLSKLRYGIWQNLFCLNWPLRFLIEIVLGVILLLPLIGICILLKKLKVKKYLVMVWCITVREVMYLLGHEKDWAVEIDNKMIDWALQKISEARRRKKTCFFFKIILILAVFIVYFLAVFVDLPVAGYISDEYIRDMQNIKAFFQQIETSLSKGYEQYTPLFISPTEDEKVTVEDIVSMPEEKEPIYIQLNEKGKSGSNIRSEADLSSDKYIICSVNENSEILYRDEWFFDGKRYWLWVYVPANGIEGWLSGQLVDSEQLQEIVENEE